MLVTHETPRNRMHDIDSELFTIVSSSTLICLARILLLPATQFTAPRRGISQHYLAQDRAIRIRPGRVKCALRGHLCGLLFLAVTRTCAPFAKAVCTKATKPLPSASSVLGMWSDGLPFTDQRRSSRFILFPD